MRGARGRADQRRRGFGYRPLEPEGAEERVRLRLPGRFPP
jgi:hypothetical protein